MHLILLYFHHFQEPKGKKRKTSRFSKNENPPDVESQGPGSEKKIQNDRDDTANGDHVNVSSSRVLTTPQVIVRYVLIIHINMCIHLCIYTKVCICVCMYLSMHLYVYIYIYIYMNLYVYTRI
jgi:hypothetical protein